MPTNKKTKAQAHYRKAENPHKTCGNCVFMRFDGGCRQVEGKVLPSYTCNLWRASRG